MGQRTENHLYMPFYDIIAEGQTEKSDAVADEIDFLRSNYDGITVIEKEGFYPKVLLTIDSESKPRRRVTLEISIVSGYPYIAPKVRISLPEGVLPESSESLKEVEVKQIQKEVREVISPCLPVGVPCIMQIISVVERVLAGDNDSSCTPPEKAIQLPNNEAPAITTTTIKTQDAMKLSVFLFHLLHKSCHLKDPESKEEANSNFEFLAQYVINELKILPKKLHKCIPWRYDFVQRAFRCTVQEALDGTDNLKKWIWSHEEDSGTFQRSSAGRYKNEFIQQRLLGSGGFAPVYVCRKKVDGRLYAVKKIVIKTNQSEKALREVQSLAALSHKHIVRYYDAWIEPGCDEDLMEFVEEPEEEESISTNESLPHPKVKRKGGTSTRIVSGGSATTHDHHYNHTTTTTTTTNNNNNDSSSSISDDTDESDDDNSGYNSSDESTQGDVLSTPYLGPTGEYQTLYIQMELCSKQTLRHLIELWDKGEETPFTSGDGESLAARILRQLLTVVAHFHRENIVHRDLKPDNILFEVESSSNGGDIGTIRVADFGLARTLQPAMKRNTSSCDLDEAQRLAMISMAEHLVVPTGELGSVLYCAPEQERGDNYDFKVDEYSIGMIALEMWLALAGKGFRERFNIMTEISRGKPIPQWFLRWNPRMSGIISSLIERDSSVRRTCEDILSTADLPGDPADIVDALETIETHGERIAGRVLHCVQHIMIDKYRKPPSMMKDVVKVLTSNVMLDLMQAINLIGILHGAAPIACYDPLIPMNPSLGELEVPSILDMSARVWALPSQPQLATASFFTVLANPHIGSFYQLYYRNRPYAVFTASLEFPRTFDNMLLDPVFSFLHLLSLSDTSSKLDIIISHAHWLNVAHPTETGSREPPEKLMHMRTSIETGDLIAPAVSKIESELVDSGLLVPLSERHELLKKFTSILLEVLPLFGKQVTCVSLFIDPALKPSETSVDRSFIKQGLFFECRTRGGGKPIAFYCSLDNFTSKCTTRSVDVHAVSLSIDLSELAAISEHIHFPQSQSLLLDGVAIRPDVYCPGQLSSCVEAAVQLWSGNIRACLRSDRDTKLFCKAMAAKKIPRVLLDGNRIISLALFQHGKVSTRADGVQVAPLRAMVRNFATEERHCSVQSAIDVVFVGTKEDKALSEAATDLYSSMMQVPPSHLAAVAWRMTEVQRTVTEVLNDTPPESFTLPELGNWLRNNMATYPLLPIVSLTDGTSTFFVNQKRFKFKKTKDGGRKKK